MYFQTESGQLEQESISELLQISDILYAHLLCTGAGVVVAAVAAVAAVNVILCRREETGGREDEKENWIGSI